MKEARYYEYRDGVVHCLLCPQNCRLRDGETGRCGVRRADGDRLMSLNYEMVSAVAVDPIEKKPLYHFYPGSYILSIGTVGCNLSCGFCQNYNCRLAGRNQAHEFGSSCAAGQELNGEASIGIAYTYSEPMVRIRDGDGAGRETPDSRTFWSPMEVQRIPSRNCFR